MCGIVGYIGNKNTGIHLVNLLKKLEYRGYDSAGIAVQQNNSFNVVKSEGNISNLEKLISPDTLTAGIAHTRWATHGKPTTTNAHPHLSENGMWAVVHNGIIENFEKLRNELETSHINFKSETDTEVIPQLLQYTLQDSTDYFNTFMQVCQKLQGSYAIACLNSNVKDHIYLAKQKSPLYVASNGETVVVASDPICFNNKIKNYYSLDENEFCDASLNSLIFYDKSHKVITKTPLETDTFEDDFNKQEFDHYMLKEINEIPIVLNKIATSYSESKILNKFNNEFMENFNKIVIVGCGTAYHAGLMGAKYIEKFSRLETHTYVASEFRYVNPIIDQQTLCIFISQSGETADTIAAQELAKSKGATTVALTNVIYSSLARKVDIVLPVCAGHEIAVASTKAYNAQITIMYMLARQLQNTKVDSNFDYLLQIKELAHNIKMPNLNEIQEIATELTNAQSVFFIGRDFDYITSEEASLKLKEITYINCTAYPSGELKHGFLALVDHSTYLFVIDTQQELLDKTLNGAYEAYSRGAKIILATQLDIPQEKTKFVHKIIKLEQHDESLMPIVSIITFQLISYYVSIKKGNNPDQPRNLAKSVTVE